MALIKSYTTNTGIECPEAYHVIVKVDTVKRVCDDPDPNNIRPKNLPDYMWKEGYYGRICVSIYFSKQTRLKGLSPVSMKCVYPTDTPYYFSGQMETDQELNFTMDINSPLSDIDQAYQHLKTLDYYSDSIED